MYIPYLVRALLTYQIKTILFAFKSISMGVSIFYGSFPKRREDIFKSYVLHNKVKPFTN